MIFQLKEILLKIFSPSYCLICLKPSAKFLCHYCQLTLNDPIVYLCPFCYQKLPFSNFRLVCRNHSKKTTLWGLLSWQRYENEVFKVLIKKFKYQGLKVAGELLIEKFIQSFRKEKEFIEMAKDGIFLPVPLYWRKQRKRGFNQAEILVKRLAEEFGFTYSFDFLFKIKNTKAQVEVELEKRKENLEGSFKAVEELKKYSKIFLVDDIITTGSTLEEISKTIKKNNPKVKIYGITLGWSLAGKILGIH